MTGSRTGTCEWCGEAFEARSLKGPLPRYCKPSHRQRSWEYRNIGRERPTGTGVVAMDPEKSRALEDAGTGRPARPRGTVPKQPRGRDAIVPALIIAAAREFASLGFRGASIRGISARANVNHGMISRHFGSKGQLLHAVLRDLAEQNAEHLHGHVDLMTYMAMPSFQLERQILGRLVLEGVDPGLLPSASPVYDVLGPRIAAHYRLSAEDGRIAVAAQSALTLGWSLFGDWIVASAGISDAGRERLVDQLVRDIRHLGIPNSSRDV